MSFQGDVAGIGLGELLQGLARGGRAGVLTLFAAGREVRVGVTDGQLLLLPEERESSEIWRVRTQRAWAARPDQRIDSVHMREIAQASRLEAMFGMLDASALHFRFAAGPIPELSPREKQSTPRSELDEANASTIELDECVLGPAVSVEYILLEHARISDELGSAPLASSIDANFVPRRRGEEPPQRALERIWQECDGSSSVAEISDRLGWPLRQARASLYALHAQGAMRLADGREQLALAQHELQRRQFARAASRLAGWCRLAPPGPASQGDAGLLLDEWQQGTLPATLAAMEPRDARSLLCKLDGAERDETRSIQRWMELRRAHREDFTSEFAALRRQQRSVDESQRAPIHDLLRVARRFQDRGQNERAACVLRATAVRENASVAARLEIGQRLIAVGKLDEGAGWVVDACRTLADGGQHDRAVSALQQLLHTLPHHREARALYSSSFGRTASGRKKRRTTLGVLGGVLVLSIAGVIRIRADEAFEQKLAQVREQLDRPEQALAQIDSLFGASEEAPIVALREQLHGRIRHRQVAARQAWILRFQECHLECTGGDPVLGLRNALEMPPIPAAPDVGGEAPPKLSDLLESLLARLEDLTLASGQGRSDVESAHAEQRLARLIDDLNATIADATMSDELRAFREELRSLKLTLDMRAAERAARREADAKNAEMAQLDALYAAGRAHAAAGDLERAVESFRKFEQAPGAQDLVPLFRKEIEAVRAHHAAVLAARELAAAGKHAEAIARLSPACQRPAEHLLPCRIESIPSGAHVRLSNGTLRTAPFVLECAPGERVAGRVELEGYDTASLVLDGPADQRIVLSRRPNVRWSARTRIEAAPVSVDDSFIVCDREGRVARVRADGTEQWSVRLRTASGIRHTPLFLPHKPGALFLCDEQGQVWILSATDGTTHGPLALGSAPTGSPRASAEGIRVHLADGRSLVWLDALEPTATPTAVEMAPSARNADAGLCMLRRSLDSGTKLQSPWSQGSVEIGSADYKLHRSDGSLLFATLRSGEWNYVAFEAPSARCARGRLWISDASGLRAFDL